MRTAFTGADVFDGERLHRGAVLVLDGAGVEGIATRVPPGAREHPLPGGTLAPGFVDLQVNGGGGAMVGPGTDAAALTRLCETHARLGATTILPTLITDTPEVTARLIAAARATPGLIGLHLEGPHLDPRRKGAHDPALIRPMTQADCNALIAAAHSLPVLLVTLAPEAATLDQIARLARAGVVVSLGHSGATAAQAQAAFAAGARMATHLFNAMSGMSARDPGLAGAVLAGGALAGIIADGHHVAPEMLRIALAARPEGLFLVSDAMAVAGTGLEEFTLGTRRVLRREGRLVLEDGTLAGADLTLPRAVAVLLGLGVAPERALAMASRIPAEAVGLADRLGHLLPGRRADLVHLDPRWRLAGVWRGGERLV